MPRKKKAVARRKRKPVTRKTRKQAPGTPAVVIDMGQGDRTAAFFARAPLTEYTHKLSGRDLYDLMGALRGPDHGGALGIRIKGQITARVRCILFGDRPDQVSSDWTRTTVQWKDVQQIGADCKEFRRLTSTTHYVDHLRSAVLASQDHPIWGGYGKFVADAAGSGYVPDQAPLL